MKDNRELALTKQLSSSKKRKEKTDPQVLTFVDMSKLKYLSRSVAQDDSKLKRKKIELPKNVNTAIIEAASEEDSDGENSAPENNIPRQVTQTPKDFAVEVLNELIDIVLESAGDGKSDSNQIASNSLLQLNKHKLHKQVFVKAKVSKKPLL